MARDVTREINTTVAKRMGYDPDAPLLPEGTRIEIGSYWGGELHWHGVGEGVVVGIVCPGQFADYSYLVVLGGEDDDAGMELNWYTCRPLDGPRPKTCRCD